MAGYDTSGINLPPSYNYSEGADASSMGFNFGGMGNYLGPLGMMGAGLGLQMFGPKTLQQKYQEALLSAVQQQGFTSLPGRGGMYTSYSLNPQGRADYLRDIQTGIKGGAYERGQGPQSPAMIWSINRALSQAANQFDQQRQQWMLQLAQMKARQTGGIGGKLVGAGIMGLGAALAPFTAGTSLAVAAPISAGVSGMNLGF